MSTPRVQEPAEEPTAGPSHLDFQVYEGQTALQEQRFAFFVYVALASSLGFFAYSLFRDQAPSLYLTLSTFLGFCACAVAFFFYKNYVVSCWIYLIFAAYAIFTAALYTGQAYSESLWLIPIVPAAAAYLLGRSQAIRIAVLCAVAILAVHGSHDLYPLEELAPDNNLDFLMLRLASLGMFTSFGIWTTVTSDRQLEALSTKTQQIDIERSRAQAATEAKSSFLANMSHEIRTPMNGMIGMTRHLHGRITDPQDRADLETVISSQESLLTLLNDILDFSKIEAGMLVIEPQVFELDRTMRDVVSLFGPRAASKGLALKLIGETRYKRAFGDEKRLRQVLCNLVGNAIKFSSKGTVDIEVKTEQGGGQSGDVPDLLTVVVRDQGIGMSQDKVERLFRKFEQVHDTVSLDRGGTGLGLAISKELVEAMGGTLSVHSASGEGSAFTIELPTKITQTQAREELTRSPKQDATSSLSAAPEKVDVLLVDDNAINRRVASLALKKLGCEVHQASDGQEAVELCHAQGFDLIFMDLRMPRLNGINATIEIRADQGGQNCKTPIVALTANAYEEDRRRCREAGMQEHLSKPFRSEDLQRVINELVLADRDLGEDELLLAA